MLQTWTNKRIRICCAVVNCENRRGRGKKSFFRFPAIPTKGSRERILLIKERRSKWLCALKRSDISESMKKPKLHICSDHFIKGKPADIYDLKNPDWTPSKGMDYDTSYTQGKTASDLTLQKKNPERKPADIYDLRNRDWTPSKCTDYDTSYTQRKTARDLTLQKINPERPFFKKKKQSYYTRLLKARLYARQKIAAQRTSEETERINAQKARAAERRIAKRARAVEIRIAKRARAAIARKERLERKKIIAASLKKGKKARRNEENPQKVHFDQNQKLYHLNSWSTQRPNNIANVNYFENVEQLKNGCDWQPSSSATGIYPEKDETVHIKMEYVTVPSEQFESMEQFKNDYEEQQRSSVTGVYPEKDETMRIKMEYVTDCIEQFEKVEEFKNGCGRHPCSSRIGLHPEEDENMQVKKKFSVGSSEEIVNVEPWNMFTLQFSIPNTNVDTQNDLVAPISASDSGTVTRNPSEIFFLPAIYPLANMSKAEYLTNYIEKTERVKRFVGVWGTGDHPNSSGYEVLPEKDENIQIKLEFEEDSIELLDL